MCQLVGGRLLHRHVSATDVGAVKAPTIQRSYSCKRSRQSVSTLQSQSSRSTALAGQVLIRRQLKRRAVLKEQIVEFDRMIMVWHRSNETSKRLHYIPGVGPMLATALVASVADPRTFRSWKAFPRGGRLPE